jgi:hypothetical protein
VPALSRPNDDASLNWKKRVCNAGVDQHMTWAVAQRRVMATVMVTLHCGSVLHKRG